MDNSLEEARNWYRNAAEYLVITKDLRGHPLEPVSHQPKVTVWRLAPYTVLLALVCEMLMKALIVYQTGKNPGGHKLDKLYEQLDEETKGEFSTYLAKRHPDWSDKIEDSLEKCSNSFIDLRYRADARTLDAYSSFWPFLRIMSSFFDDYAYRSLYETNE